MQRQLIRCLMICCALVASSCSAIRVIPADKEVSYLPAGQSYTAPKGGMWLVPPARMQEILDALSK